ncbi:MAG: DNA recombination protein RmuC [Syntrophorhabdaceae bacterium]|nr:DNA recombination protein RmuC [Syntrophorhabdales bacterium]MBP9560478.1 DNA recombination protein RmuC [Syntrophorhabdaceae bacterium]
MNEMLIYIIPIFLFIVLILQIVLLSRGTSRDSRYIREIIDSIERSNERAERTMRDELSRNRDEMANSVRQTREELGNILKSMDDTLNQQLINFSESSIKAMTEIASLQKSQLDFMHGQLNLLTESNEKKMESLRITIEGKLNEIREDNARQLEQMRLTVDEKLQGTLEKRLGESFRQVSERLEQVYKGLGEMQALASGVGDLKKVLTNVKTRGLWGEVQLGTLLEQVLTPDQYERNVSTRQGGERVEFAVKLPGRAEDREDIVWLPIDAKFPIEDYQRLIEAQEKGDTDQADAAGRQLESRIKQCASDISNKYINPPKTTDFGILFLPTEGLFAEVIRRTSLTEYVQRECRVVIAGPTTLWSILNSLQMGFRTLAIERRSSEVWKLLAAVKTEWTKYGDILNKVQRKLHEASDTIEDAQTRTRAIGRKLKNVQMLPSDEAKAVLNTDDIT